LRALVAVALLFAGGCETTRPCRSLTLLVDIRLDPASAAADQLEVDVSLDGVLSKTNTISNHAPGDAQGTYEIDFLSGYPAGHVATVEVRATAAGTQVGDGVSSLALPLDCGTLEVDVHGGP
jgi:hypothetical protein